MLNYIIKRTLYSLLILLGVVVMTFLLFSVAAGDPAAAVLGKDARSEEVDALRRELGSDLPLFYGRLCRTEAYSFDDGEARRVFALDDPAAAVITLDDGTEELIELDPALASVPLPPGTRNAEFFRVQPSGFNSQFLRALGEIVSFRPQFPYLNVLDFGRTLTTREPIRHILWRGVWPSLCLMLPIFIGELVVGIALALIAAGCKGGLIDRALVLFSVAGMSVSYLVVIIFAQWFLGYYYGLFPVWGWGGVRFLLLPVLVGVLCGIGGNVRFYRTVFVDELKKEYLRTAAAKGLSPVKIYGKHLLRNAALQIITRAGAALPFLFTGSLLLESFFGIPGLGFAGVDALYNSDLQLLKALVITSALLFVVINLICDLAYAWADPRVRLE